MAEVNVCVIFPGIRYVWTVGEQFYTESVHEAGGGVIVWKLAVFTSNVIIKQQPVNSRDATLLMIYDVGLSYQRVQVVSNRNGRRAILFLWRWRLSVDDCSRRANRLPPWSSRLKVWHHLIAHSYKSDVNLHMYMKIVFKLRGFFSFSELET